MAEPDRPLLAVRGLRIEATTYPPGEKPKDIVIVHELDFELRRGEVLGVIGESGAGKSTAALCSLAHGRGGVRFSAGRVLLDGEELLSMPRRALRSVRGSRVCYVAQSAAAAFNPAHRLMDQVVESSLLHAVCDRESAEKRAVALFAKLGLPEPEQIGERYPHQVSGGQLQRVMTAMALCPEPDLIVFDEPTTALDVTTQIDVLAAIKEAIRDTGVAALYITHDLAVVAQVADEIMVLRDGRLIERGDTAQIIGAPREAYTRALVSVRSIEHTEQPPAAAPVLAVDDVSAGYGRGLDILKHVSVALYPGQTLAVVGESGSGKSTLARAITGLLPPRAGQVQLDGQALPAALSGRSREQLRDVQMIYQMADVAMNPRHTVSAIIGRPLQFYFGLQGSELRARVSQLLDDIEMGEGFAERYPAELSGGQKQRVCIARALAAQPRVIICDEVTSALDPLVADGILRLLLDLQARQQVAYLFITHDLATVEAIADSIAVMLRGEVVRYGPKSEVLSPPFDDYTDLLLGSVPQMRVGWLEEALAARRMDSAGH